jgi:imidazolonepropionase-like amidohydrolase
MTTVLVPDRILDTRRRQIVSGRAVVVEDGRIGAVIASSDVPDGPNVINLPNHTLLPGLIDCHTHLIGQIDNGQGYAQLVTRSAAQEVLEGVRHAAEVLDCGFTTVRDVGTFRAFADVALREAIDAGWVRGPRIQCAGAYVTSPGGAGDITGLAIDTDQIVPRELRFGVVSGVGQARTTVRQILGRGADFIKVIATGAPQTMGTNPGSPELTEDEIRAAVEIATEHGVHVAAHAHGAEAVKRAVRAGARSIEHGSLLDDEAVESMRRAGTYLVADLYNAEWIASEGSNLGYASEVIEKNEAVAEAQRQSFARCVHAGVRIAFGSDCGMFPHRYAGRQFAHYVKNGLSPIQAILSATLWAAELMGWEDRVGSIEGGFYADLMAVEGDPTMDITLLESVSFVMKNGRVEKSPVPA